MSAAKPTRARCSFDGCSESIIGRVVLALVDQLCADADIDIALLDALDYPLEETFSAFFAFGIVGVEVRVVEQRLEVDIELATEVDEPTAVLGDVGEVVQSFFEVRSVDDTSSVALIGSLR